MNAQWDYDRDAVSYQGTPRGLYASAIDLSLRLHNDKLFSISAPTRFLWRCWRPNGTLTATSLLFYCVLIRTQSHGAYFVHIYSMCHRMTFFDFRGNPTATNEDAIALTLLRVPWRATLCLLYILGSPRWCNSDVTGFNKYPVPVLVEFPFNP